MEILAGLVLPAANKVTERIVSGTVAKSPSQTGVIREVNCSVINYVF